MIDPLKVWITELHFCPLYTVEGSVLLGSTAHGSRKQTNEGIWWPQIVDSAAENLGSMVIVQAMPTRLVLGLHFVAYGTGSEILSISVMPDDNKLGVLAELEVSLNLDAQMPIWPVNVTAMTIAIPEITLKHTGLYWLRAQVGDGQTLRIPLIVHDQPTFRRFELERRRNAGLPMQK